MPLSLRHTQNEGVDSINRGSIDCDVQTLSLGRVVKWNLIDILRFNGVGRHRRVDNDVDVQLARWLD